MKQLMVLAAFVILTSFTPGAAVAAEPPVAPELCATAVAAELPAALTAPEQTEQRMPPLEAIDAWSSRQEVATCSGSYQWRCYGSDCGGYGRGQRRCCVNGSCGSWENTPICC